MQPATRKQFGSYYSPIAVVQSLVAWALRSPADRLLDPACGDGRFLAEHPRCHGVERDPLAAAAVRARLPGRLLHEGDFFAWAGATAERFDGAVGNPPFIRYQRFTGAARQAALRLCRDHGVTLTALASSWAPFLIGAATLLRPGGRMAFVVPAEIGHAPYARPVLEYLVAHFRRVQLIAVQERLFPELSEDCWLLYADGFGAATGHLLLSAQPRFTPQPRPPAAAQAVAISRAELDAWNWRLRPFLLPEAARVSYRHIAATAPRLGDVARVGIGYVTGANDFFHLRPSQAAHLGIPQESLPVAVRNGRALAELVAITPAVVAAWLQADRPVLLLHLGKQQTPTAAMHAYLATPAAASARTAYKCRQRSPWYAVPDVIVPDAFLSYMSGSGPRLVENQAGCVGTNSVHVVRLNGRMPRGELLRRFADPLTALSAEIEGHPLGGGLLKLEPREAARIVLADPADTAALRQQVQDATRILRSWRHATTPTSMPTTA